MAQNAQLFGSDGIRRIHIERIKNGFKPTEKMTLNRLNNKNQNLIKNMEVLSNSNKISAVNN